MTTSTDFARACPSCGLTLTYGETSCPRCNKEITNAEKVAPKAKKPSSKVAKVECPHCGELVSKRSKRCPACRTSLPTGFYKVSKKPVHDETRESSATLVEQAVTNEASEFPTTSSPPVLEASGLENPASEASVEGSVKSIETAVAVDAAPANEAVEPVKIQTVTAEPQAPLGPANVKEPDVKIEVASGVAGTLILTESVSMEESAKMGAGEMSITEPALLVNTAPEDILPVHVGDGATTPDFASSVGITNAINKPQTIESDRTTPELATMIDSDLGGESTKSDSDAGTENSPSCGACQAIVLRSSMDSSSWMADLVKKAAILEQARSAPEPSQAKIPEGLGAPISETEKKPVKLVRKRKLKSAKPSAAQGVSTSPTSGSVATHNVVERGKETISTVGDQAVVQKNPLAGS